MRTRGTTMIVGAPPWARLNDGLGEFEAQAPSLDRMNLARHAAVLWRFRRVTVAGLLLGIFLAVYASYDITTSGLVKRGHPTYMSRSQLLITQPGCPECRSVLPVTPPLSPADNQSKRSIPTSSSSPTRRVSIRWPTSTPS